MRAGLLLAIVFASPLALAAQVWVPSGADWAVVAPRAGAFAHDAGAFLDQAAGEDSVVSARLVNNDFVRQTGLGLLSAKELTADGVDLHEPWTIFQRRGVTYLDVFVKDPVRLRAALDAWGASRQLRSRQVRTLPKGKGVVVTFARAQGSWTAAGYILAGHQAVVLLSPARSPQLPLALRAMNDAIPLHAPGTGTLVVWAKSSPLARQAWLVLRASASGIALKGSAYGLQPGWLDASRARSGWILGLTGSVPREMGLRLRFLASDRGVKTLARRFESASVAKTVADAFATLLKGPDEIVVGHLALPKPGTEESDDAIADLIAPALVIDRRGPLGANVSTAALSGGMSGTVILGVGPGAPTELPPTPSGPPSLSCPRGLPVASLRVDAATLASSLDGISFFQAMRDPFLLGLYALHKQVAPLADRLEPLVAVACQRGRNATLVGHVNLRR